MIFKKSVGTVLLLSLVGCGSISEITSLNEGVYLISSHGVVGNGAASAEEVKAVATANEFCRKNGLQLKVISTEKTDPFFGRAPAASIKFSCA